jgi:hypothetical protein
VGKLNRICGSDGAAAILGPVAVGCGHGLDVTMVLIGLSSLERRVRVVISI